jgi:monoamine oxidase
MIIAVPLSILKDGDITFSLALPGSKASAMSRIGFGASMRIMLDFRQNLWGTDTSFIQGGTQGLLYFNSGLSRSKFHKNLTITINGPKAEQLALDPDGIVTEIAKELDLLLDNKATSNLKLDEPGIIIQDWTKEEFIKGGYSYPLAGGGEADRVALAEQIDGMLFFAGEATDVKGDWGTVNGALNSGERAALELIDSIVNPAVV